MLTAPVPALMLVLLAITRLPPVVKATAALVELILLLICKSRYVASVTPPAPVTPLVAVNRLSAATSPTLKPE